MSERVWLPWYVKYLIAFAIPIQIARWLFGSIWGMLILSWALYYLVRQWGWVDPFGFDDLVLWFDSLPQASRSTIGASLLTIVGFLIAFQSSFRNILREKLVNKELEAADAIRHHYMKLRALAGELDLYAQKIMNAAKEVANDPSSADFWADYLLSDLEEKHDAQQRLVELAVGGPMLGPNWSVVTLQKLGLPKILEKMSDIAIEFVDIAFFLPTPNTATTNVLPADKIILVWFSEERAKKYHAKHSSIMQRLVWPGTFANAVLHAKITPDNLNVWLNGLLNLAIGGWHRMKARLSKKKSATNQ